jgi:hypothetical protein
MSINLGQSVLFEDSNSIDTQTSAPLDSVPHFERLIRAEWDRKRYKTSGREWRFSILERDYAGLSQFDFKDQPAVRNWFTNIWSVKEANKYLEIYVESPYVFKRPYILKKGCVVAVGFLLCQDITQYYVPDKYLTDAFIQPGNIA